MKNKRYGTVAMLAVVLYYAFALWMDSTKAYIGYTTKGWPCMLFEHTSGTFGRTPPSIFYVRLLINIILNTALAIGLAEVTEYVMRRIRRGVSRNAGQGMKDPNEHQENEE